MSAVSLTGADTIIIDGRVITDLADADAGMIVFPDDIAKVKASKNGNTIFALNETGRVADVTLRILLGSSDDTYLNSRLQEMKNDFSSFILFVGAFIKRVGDGTGNVASAVYQCSAGVVKKQIEAKTNADGDVDQSVAVWTIAFGNSDRSIQ